MLRRFEVLKDRERIEEVKRTLDDVIAGKEVSAERLRAAQGFLRDLLEEVNSKRPQHHVCGGNVLDVLSE